MLREQLEPAWDSVVYHSTQRTQLTRPLQRRRRRDRGLFGQHAIAFEVSLQPGSAAIHRRSTYQAVVALGVLP